MPNVDKLIMNSQPNKKVIFSLTIIVLISCYIGRQAEWQTQRISQHYQTEALVLQALQNPAPQTLTFGFVGDIMLDRDVRASVKLNFAGDYSRLFANATFLGQPDITFANLEGPVSDTGTNKHNLYSFRMDPKVIPALKNAGVDVVSVSYTHLTLPTKRIV